LSRCAPVQVTPGLDRTGADNAWRNHGLVEEEVVIIGDRDNDVAALLHGMQVEHISKHLQSGFVGMEEFRWRARIGRQPVCS
jgi:hypothetical protein